MGGARRIQGILVTGCLILGVGVWLSAFAFGDRDSIDLSSTDAAAAAASETGNNSDALDIGQVIEEQEQARSAAQLDTSMAEASLDALRQNGALPASDSLSSQSAQLGLVHSVSCLPTSCDRIAQWAASNNFLASSPVLTLGHGGAEEFHVELRQALAADAAAMTASANLVADAVASLAETDNDITDLTYAGWAPELITGGADS